MTSYDRFQATLDAIAILNRLRIKVVLADESPGAWGILDSAGRHLRRSLLDNPGLAQEVMAFFANYDEGGKNLR